MDASKDLYFITLHHSVGNLKEELLHRYPEWNFKQGHHNFLIYDAEKERSLEEMRELPIIFKLVTGRLLKIGDKLSIENEVQDAYEKYDCVTLHRWDLVEEDGVMGDRKAKGPILDIIRFSEDEYALGVRYQMRGDFAPFKGSSPIPAPEISMKHGYQKMGEVFKHFRPHVGYDEVFLDLGCAPGGASYYLLDHGYRVIGVDVNEVSPELKEKFKEGFLQLRQPVDEINVKHLKGLPPIDWVVCELDLSWKEILPSLNKLISKLEECQGLIFHIRVEDQISLDDIEVIKASIRDAGLGLIRKGLLPSHGKEFCIFAKKED